MVITIHKMLVGNGALPTLVLQKLRCPVLTWAPQATLPSSSYELPLHHSRTHSDLTRLEAPRMPSSCMASSHKSMDCPRLQVVYILINVAFGLAIFICMQGGVFPQDIDLQVQPALPQCRSAKPARQTCGSHSSFPTNAMSARQAHGVLSDFRAHR
eukprot:3256320-Rhodomonas_salina.10